MKISNSKKQLVADCRNLLDFAKRKQERQAAIDRFHKYHGDFISHPVEVDIDVNAMLLLWHSHYRGKVDITKYFPDLDVTKLKLSDKAP